MFKSPDEFGDHTTNKVNINPFIHFLWDDHQKMVLTVTSSQAFPVAPLRPLPRKLRPGRTARWCKEGIAASNVKFLGPKGSESEVLVNSSQLAEKWEDSPATLWLCQNSY